MSSRRGVMVTLADGAGTQWFGVPTFAQAAKLCMCKAGQIERFDYVTEATYIGGHSDND